MIDLVAAYVLPAAYALLPAPMISQDATALLLAIGLQESRFTDRRQRGGPARGFWQFEVSGVAGVMDHPAVQVPLSNALAFLRYDHNADPAEIHPALEHNDVLAAVFARCLLWTSPLPLPTPGGIGAAERAWRIYVSLWRPGKPIRESWGALYAEAAARGPATRFNA